LAIVNALLIPPLIALAVSFALIAAMLRARLAGLALDHPNARSLHDTPMPRLGGIGILAGIAAAWSYGGPAIDWRVWAGLGLLIAVSLFDDFKNVSVLLRFPLHLISAFLAMAAVLLAEHAIWLVLIATLITAWILNLYNFMDGSDGLAGGMAVIGFGAYGAAAAAGGDFSFAAANLSVAAAALGFLCFNFPPARIFMGDAGAVPLGYLAAVLAVLGWQRGDWPLWFGAVVFSPFIVDASLTLLKRLVRGARVWQAHREHYYQRLVQAGWGHRRTALMEYGLMACMAAIAAAASQGAVSVQVAAVAAVIAVYCALIALLERKLPRCDDHA
jgi:UDP-GlcNAc:undecaprenyl-phosphate/decaprenyl-phosphate GlcNAc-1-phosphate transferase